jgi:hypothetical protein
MGVKNCGFGIFPMEKAKYKVSQKLSSLFISYSDNI